MAQQQQKEAQAALEQQAAQINLANARAKADTGLGLERVSRIEENKALAVERKAEAAKDREMAVLNFARALKEIEDVDISQLEKLLNISQLVKAREKGEEVDAEKPTEKEPPPQNLAALG